MKLEKTDVKVLEFMIRNIDKEFSIKQIADILKRPYVKIHKSIKRLIESKIISKTIKGKSHYCNLNYKNNLDVVCFINSQRAKNFLEKNKKIAVLILNIQENINFPDYILVLFGSFANETANKNSDVDMAIITSSENKEKAGRIMNSVRRMSNLKIHSFEFTYNEFIEMINSKELNVGKEIIKNSIIFNGCEQFYSCMKLLKFKQI